ncbi:hypothetical protein TWF970_010769 [Orbilia oligospora]|uniref:Uncharacterized protein n=1 Tax=Orbilia oligospora TaxID=2813651 RepID=A0A7C8VHB5_ORBOL|nr:hypothetical protein TWF970_010769 [Orbilia oligospora]
MQPSWAGFRIEVYAQPLKCQECSVSSEPNQLYDLLFEGVGPSSAGHVEGLLDSNLAWSEERTPTLNSEPAGGCNSPAAKLAAPFLPWMLAPYEEFQTDWSSVPGSLTTFDMPTPKHQETTTAVGLSSYKPDLAPPEPRSPAQSIGIETGSHTLNWTSHNPSHDANIKIPKLIAAQVKDFEAPVQLPPLKDLLKNATAPVDTGVSSDSGMTPTIKNKMLLQSVLEPKDHQSYVHDAHDGTAVGSHLSPRAEISMLDGPENSDSKIIPDPEVSELQSEVERASTPTPDSNERADLPKEIKPEIVPYEGQPPTSGLELATIDSNGEENTLEISTVAGTEREVTPIPQISTEVIDLTDTKSEIGDPDDIKEETSRRCDASNKMVDPIKVNKNKRKRSNRSNLASSSGAGSSPRETRPLKRRKRVDSVQDLHHTPVAGTEFVVMEFPEGPVYMKRIRLADGSTSMKMASEKEIEAFTNGTPAPLATVQCGKILNHSQGEGGLKSSCVLTYTWRWQDGSEIEIEENGLDAGLLKKYWKKKGPNDSRFYYCFVPNPCQICDPILEILR